MLSHLTIYPERHRSPSNVSGLRFSNSGKGAKLRLEAADFAAVAADYGHYEVMHGLMKKQGDAHHHNLQTPVACSQTHTTQSDRSQGASNKRSWKDRYFVQVFNFLYVGTAAH